MHIRSDLFEFSLLTIWWRGGGRECLRRRLASYRSRSSLVDVMMSISLPSVSTVFKSCNRPSVWQASFSFPETGLPALLQCIKKCSTVSGLRQPYLQSAFGAFLISARYLFSLHFPNRSLVIKTSLARFCRHGLKALLTAGEMWRRKAPVLECVHSFCHSLIM